MKLSQRLSENIKLIRTLLPIDTSFDLMTRNLYLGETKAFLLGINGFCQADVLQGIISDLQNPGFTQNLTIENITKYMEAKIGYSQTLLTADTNQLVEQVLCGASLLLIDGFEQGILIDLRSYPDRSISEPDTEHITQGARDGFVETLLSNANLIRRRIRCATLTFQITNVGSVSKTDVAVTYLADIVNQKLLEEVLTKLNSLDITSLTMGAKSLEELLIPKRWRNPLPSILLTERPDVACSYLTEGHIILLVDNSPLAIILPCTIFQFTQSPEDYYKSPIVGSYFRFVRFACIPVSLLLMPSFLLICAFYPQVADKWQLLSTGNLSATRLIFYVFIVEFLLDLFKYSASLNSNRFSGSLSIVGGLIIGDVAVSLNWASQEILFYGAITLLTSLSLSNIAFADGIRVYRIFLIIITALGGTPGFVIGLTLVSLSILTTPTFGGMSYFWPLFPFNGKALLRLLFRVPTSKAQPSKVWHQDQRKRTKG